MTNSIIIRADDSPLPATFNQANVQDLSQVATLQADAVADITLVASSVSSITQATVQSIFRGLKPNGVVHIVTSESTAQLESLRPALVTAGFTNVAITTSSQTQLPELNASKPEWKQGASAKLSFKRAAPAAASAVWSLNAMDEDAPLEDEDALLARETEAVSTAKKASDCGTNDGPVRKACKNCSCGLAEELAAGEQPAKPVAAKSACGNCSLGDAFRCAGCPFLGQPAFTTSKAGGVKLAL